MYDLPLLISSLFSVCLPGIDTSYYRVVDGGYVNLCRRSALCILCITRLLQLKRLTLTVSLCSSFLVYLLTISNYLDFLLRVIVRFVDQYFSVSSHVSSCAVIGLMLMHCRIHKCFPC